LMSLPSNPSITVDAYSLPELEIISFKKLMYSP